ncbi:hypothetical protein SAMN04488056_102185 [Cohaesibacter marisflavi]|uniref:Uncharacterized protein n=1 Tax=Cohaesibacter marisflavi TaxID=655353 RepID=A0A1I5CCA0_9HYPH|nr:hypothetical protein [Cohaesibacter marisflavi]SFN84526.1 hypothetical protein SAMN04488056_102185 [Cohaesibacter marisflavi]
MISRKPLATVDCKDVYEHAMLWAMKDVIAELRLVDAAHLISYVFTDSHANISDIVASSSELFLKANTLFYRGESTAQLDWSTPPTVRFEMAFRHLDLDARFALNLIGDVSTIAMQSVRYEDGSDGSECDIERFVNVLTDAHIRRPSKDWADKGLLM